jgi:hypothetical protein
MSLSRQVLSSPFDWDDKSDDRKVKEDESVATPLNIMVDKRIRRRSALVANSSQAKPADITNGVSIIGNSEAKLKVSTPVKNANESIENLARGNRKISTPSKDRHHVQTDDEDEVAASFQREKSTQTMLQCGA